MCCHTSKLQKPRTNTDNCKLILLEKGRNDLVHIKTHTYKFVAANHPEEIKILGTSFVHSNHNHGVVENHRIFSGLSLSFLVHYFPSFLYFICFLFVSS